eukprot:TRINITY_DN24094_c0_g3_i2.p1 TRINITY_DN24094_c0_g3~~TRINITY_DN24094_c0_g3_i2.p1  ORF type:complete len:819 (+),score=62.81 TRINITY_DN24094_c0_g3_i2:39-2495(+)
MSKVALAACLVCQYCDLGVAEVIINEFIELLNAGEEAVDLTGYALSDNHGPPWYYSKGFVFGNDGCASPVLEPGERLLLCRYDDCSYTFGVGADDYVTLYDPNKTAIDNTGVLPGIELGMKTVFHLTWARVPDKTGSFWFVGRATPGAENSQCRWPQYCTDCAPLSYSLEAKRCICPAGQRRTSSVHPLLCEPCAAGRYTSSNSTDYESCLPCRAGFVSTEGTATCEACAVGTFAVGGSQCVSCPASATTFSEGTTSLFECVCGVGYYATVDAGGDSFTCTSCDWGRSTSFIGAKSAEDCVTHWSLLAPYLLLLWIPVCILPIVLTAYACHSRHRQRKHAQELKKKLSQGVASISQIRHPMCLISLPCFLELSLADMSYCHEGARDAGQIMFLDSPKNIARFQELDRKILFFSYTWMSWETLGPDALQLQCMKQAASRVCEEQRHDPEMFYIWLDVLSIPQATEDCKVLAIDSLFMYASVADFLVVVCPPSYHQQTGEPGGVGAYQARTWCRVEQMAHFCSHGSESMYITTQPGHLLPVDHDWIRQAVYIFEGEVTCCRLGHQNGGRCDKELIVPTALAMYANLLWKVTQSDLPHDSVEAIWELIRCNHDRAFPRTFEFKYKSGQTRTRELFGSMITWVAEELSSDDSQLAAKLMSPETRLSGKAGAVTTVKRKLSRGRIAEASLSQAMRQALQHGFSMARKQTRHDSNCSTTNSVPLCSPHQFHTKSGRHDTTSTLKNISLRAVREETKTEEKKAPAWTQQPAVQLKASEEVSLQPTESLACIKIDMAPSWMDCSWDAVLVEGKPSQPSDVRVDAHA